MKQWKAGDQSWQVKWVDKDEADKYRFNEDEFGTEAEALAEVERVVRLEGVSGASVVKWSHQHNMPGCLPAVRAYSLSLTNYELVDGVVVDKPVDIHERCY